MISPEALAAHARSANVDETQKAVFLNPADQNVFVGQVSLDLPVILKVS